MSSKGPGLFTDIGKKAKDLLNKDYSYDNKLTYSSCTDSGLTITPTVVNKGVITLGDVAVQYKYQNTVVDAKVDQESKISTNITFNEVLPSTKAIATFKFPDYNSCKMEVQYLHDHASVTTAVGLNQSPAIDLSATVGYSSVAVGAEASYDTKSGSFSKYSAGISATRPELNASIVVADKGDTLRASYVHTFESWKKASGVVEITRKFSTNENTFTAGGSCVLDPLTVFKARANNHGKIGALLQHELKPKSVMTISGEFDTKSLNQQPKLGVSLSIK